MQTLREKLYKTIKFTPSGWIVLNEWVNPDTPQEYLNTIKFDDLDFALDYLISDPKRYTISSECVRAKKWQAQKHLKIASIGKKLFWSKVETQNK